MNKAPSGEKMSDKVFRWAKIPDKLAIGVGTGAIILGATAVGAVLIGGSLASMKITDRLKDGFDNWRNKTKTSLGGEALKAATRDQYTKAA